MGMLLTSYGILYVLFGYYVDIMLIFSMYFVDVLSVDGIYVFCV